MQHVRMTARAPQAQTIVFDIFIKILLVPRISTSTIYLCRRNLKTRKIMWLAVIIGVCLAVEVLSYLSGGEFRLKKEEKEQPEETPVFFTQTSLKTLP